MFSKLTYVSTVITASLTAAAALPMAGNGGGGSRVAGECHGRICHAVNEFCSTFTETCMPCATICNESSHNYQMDQCARECAEYNKFEPLQAEMQTILTQQTITLILLGLLIGITLLRYTWQCLRWLRHKRCVTLLLKKLRPSSSSSSSAHQASNGKDIGIGATIPNVLAINDLERAPSHIYSATGAEGSVMTMTTPVSTRYPAENSTPTSVPAEYSYDNQALAITPISEKPNGTAVF